MQTVREPNCAPTICIHIQLAPSCSHRFFCLPAVTLPRSSRPSTLLSISRHQQASHLCRLSSVCQAPTPPSIMSWWAVVPVA